MSATSLQGHILTPAGFVHGSLHLGADGRIAAITGEPVSEAQVREGGAPIVLPGFIDLHVHYPQLDVIGSPADGLLPWLDSTV